MCVCVCVCVCVQSMFVMLVSRNICVPVHLYVHEAGKGKLNTTHQQEKDGMCVPIYVNVFETTRYCL